MKTITKAIYLFCLFSLVCVPIYMWAITKGAIDMSGLGGFAAGAGVSMGVLTGAMASKNFSKNGTTPPP